MRLAVFASGNGSNFEALQQAIVAGTLAAEISLVVCDQEQAYVCQRAQAAGVKLVIVSPKDYVDRQAYDQQLLNLLAEHQIELLVLAGYLRLIGQPLLGAYGERIINIHPSLLPAFPGLNSIQEAFEAGVAETGVTVHYIDAGIDTGPIIAQTKVPITAKMSLADVEEAIHQAEHQLYPKVLGQLIAKAQATKRLAK